MEKWKIAMLETLAHFESLPPGIQAGVGMRMIVHVANLAMDKLTGSVPGNLTNDESQEHAALVWSEVRQMLEEDVANSLVTLVNGSDLNPLVQALRGKGATRTS